MHGATAHLGVGIGDQQRRSMRGDIVARDPRQRVKCRTADRRVSVAQGVTQRWNRPPVGEPLKYARGAAALGGEAGAQPVRRRGHRLLVAERAQRPGHVHDERRVACPEQFSEVVPLGRPGVVRQPAERTAGDVDARVAGGPD